MRVARVVAAVVVGLAFAFAVYMRLIAPREHADSPPVRPSITGVRLPNLGDLPWAQGPSSSDSVPGQPAIIALFSESDPPGLRQLPIVEGWFEAYSRYGLHVVGVHEPDFAFASDTAVTAALARRLGLTFSIALDASYRLREVVGDVGGGPRLLLVDTAGVVRANALGTAAMPAFESLVRETVRRLHPEGSFPGEAPGASVTAAPAILPHVIHLGVGRAREGPLAGAIPGKSQPFTAQFRFQVEGKPEVPYPVGWWTPSAEGVTAFRGGAETFVAMRYSAGALWAVMSPPADQAVRVWILSDEQWLKREAYGADVRQDSRGAAYVEVTEPRLYAIARATSGEHVVKLSPGAPGVTMHALVIEPLEDDGSQR